MIIVKFLNLSDHSTLILLSSRNCFVLRYSSFRSTILSFSSQTIFSQKYILSLKRFSPISGSAFSSKNF